ncbi:MAG: thiol-disulfide isomerase [Acidobacteria bacterium]|nr:thiol-disulfide isomerase [Acidobacteriota bacterium]
MTAKKLFLGLLIAAAALGFGTLHSSANSNTKKAVTFSKDVAPIFFKNCADCHRANDIAPMSLMSYKEARPWARSIKEKVVTREMPPWSPDPKYGEFANDHRLAQTDIDTIVAWVDGGAKEGNPKDLPALPAFTQGGWQIGKPDVVLSMEKDWVVEVNAPDNYINFWIPTNFKEDKWIQAAEIMPGNRKVVHHVIAFIQPAKMAEARMNAEKTGKRTSNNNQQASMMYWDGTLRRVKMDAPVVDNTCDNQAMARRAGGGGGEEQEGALLAGYAPGKGLDVWPVGTAKKVPAGSYIMFQMHYSAFRGGLLKPEIDRTKLGLIFAKEPPDKMIYTAGVVNATFKIPAGDGNHEVVACMTVPRDIELLTYMPHMHLRGKDMRYDVIYPDGKKETLLWVPKFSFNWQTMYYLKTPVKIPKGTKVIITAHFDNSTKNKYNPDPTKDVRWGDPTYDEMMIGWFDMLLDNPTKNMAAKTGGK